MIRWTRKDRTAGKTMLDEVAIRDRLGMSNISTEDLLNRLWDLENRLECDQEGQIREADKCPFCGSLNTKVFSPFEGEFAIFCRDCGAYGPLAKTPDTASVLWNSVTRN